MVTASRSFQPLLNLDKEGGKMGNQPNIYVKEMNSPIGILTLAALDEGFCYLGFGAVEEENAYLKIWAKKNKLSCELKSEENEHLSNGLLQLTEYFEGRRQAFDLPLVLKGSPFQIRVWEALQQIPFGETKTYKDIAQMIGNPKAVRAVGGANNKNPISIIIPCHRVIGSSGALVGYGGGLDKKELLLNHEKQQKS